jgi:predicted nucleic acid-binding protein
VIVLDTNVVSELMRAAPSNEVVAWLRAQRAGSLLTTAVTVAEIRHGLERLPNGRRATELRRIADETLGAFAGQVLAFDLDAANRYGVLVAERERAGRPIAALDAQIAAICLSRGASLATRNVRDFGGTGVEVLDPWGP